ncbi:hypothetical protein BpHYR1_033174 [Brachionus plicatilis]|uniref:Uncharacterized protein n=1 Tax=Brachionus plicatilis TaxID=10195 RepID=A0A3M7QM54_BRAPC|nr:hypothetical protein BpHYR1_033174 [Brachionus plicatilis]
MGTWALTLTEGNKLDVFRRTQLRRVVSIHYPNKISNEDFYKKTTFKLISEDMYQVAKTFQDRPHTTMPIVISHKDLKSIEETASKK